MSTIEAQRLQIQAEIKKCTDQKQKSLLIEKMRELSMQNAAAEAKKPQFEIKTPKGTRDFNAQEMALRERVFAVIKSKFKKYGATTIDTPVFELKEILGGKYGEDSKLIYDLADQGGELLALRYDLTVPFARYLAMNRDAHNSKRYHIAKVYRRDNPSIKQGRLREFYQCDFDISGQYDKMIPDSQCLKVAADILTSLEIGEFYFKINHRMILDGMFAVCGVPADKIRTISSAVDKLDKATWDEVKKEMVVEKGLDSSVADKIGNYVKFSGSKDLIENLLKDKELVKSADAKTGLEELKLLFEYLECYKMLHLVKFDLSLARGLDYYTGVIYEAVMVKSKGSDLEGIGSIAAGGRYDNLVGMFSGTQVPCVGVSIGIERVFAIIQKQKKNEIKSETDVLVISPDGNLKERMKIATDLWDADIKCEFVYKDKPKMKAQLSQCEKSGIPIAVIVGNQELEKGGAIVKVLETKTENFIERKDLVSTIKELLKSNSKQHKIQ